MNLLRKIRIKDWRRIAFAIVTITGVGLGLALIFNNPPIGGLGAVLFGVWLLSLRPYLYLRHLVFPRWNRLPENSWSSYFYED